MSEKVVFWMEEVDSKGVVVANTRKNLEEDFVGLKYSKCEGFNTIGKARIYTESYADSNNLRVHIPTNLTNEATTLSLHLFFIGANRQDVYDSFNEYIRHGIHTLYDTRRMKKITFCVIDEIKPTSEQYVGSEPYFEVVYKLQCLNGIAEKVN